MNETKLCSQESTTCQSELERVFTVLQGKGNAQVFLSSSTT
jgi:hypothetical protein